MALQGSGGGATRESERGQERQATGGCRGGCMQEHAPHLRAVHDERDVDVAAAKVRQRAVAVGLGEHHDERDDGAYHPDDDVLQGAELGAGCNGTQA